MTTPTNNPATFGGMGKLEFAPTNAPDDPSPTWVDITQWVETQSPGSALEITRGRQSELNIVESSQLKCVLKNFDGRFTFGNAGGAYGSNWAPAKQIRYSETVLGKQYILFQGWIEYPDIAAWQPIGQMYVQLSALDRLTRLARGAPFLSTLGAQIESNATALGINAYWPLLSSTGLVPRPLGSTQVPLRIAKINSITILSGAAAATSSFSGNPVQADDAQTLRLLPQVSGSTMGQQIYFAGPVNAITVSSTTITMSVWVYYEDVAPTGNLFFQLDDVVLNNVLNLQRAPTWSFGVSLNANAASASLNCNPLPSWKWNLLTQRLTLPSGLVEMWMNDSPAVSGTCTGVIPSSVTFLSPTIQGIQGNVAHLQIYLGTQFTRAAHLAQYQAGLTGLEQQTTGQRINTILNYAGVASGPRQIDGGQSYMQVAKLAGQTPLQALQNASGTERGRFFVKGDGTVVFHDRVRIYNV